MSNNVNDNERVRRERAAPDAHGQAALLLAESLLHALIERGVLGVRDAIEVVEAAAEVKQEIAADMGDSHETLQHSLAILNAIGNSLAVDLNGNGAA